ncbi:MAG TPA: hydrogenase maturation protease [Bryobacteraceae bacterium]|nr:hydrogenase maturation protease [Bryobacteraceae bacterium]
MKPRILVAGIGNIFLGDDAFGCEVAQRLAARTLPENIRVVDYGIRGYDLAYALMDDYTAAILVDATSRGERPGTLYTLEIDTTAMRSGSGDPHGMDPVHVLAMVRAMGGKPPRIYLVGCEPGETEERMGLSEPVQAALDGAAEMVESLIHRIEKGAEYEQPSESGLHHGGGGGGHRDLTGHPALHPHQHDVIISTGGKTCV